MIKRSLIIFVGLIIIVVLLVNRFACGKTPDESQLSSSPKITARQLYDQASEYKKSHNKLKAKEVYQKILDSYTDFENIETVQKELDNLNIEIITSNVETPQTIVHEVKIGDTLGKLAKKYKTTIELIKKRNGLKGSIIKVGQHLSIWTGTFNIFIDKSQNMLFLKNKDEIVKMYTVSTGSESSTPVGEYKIVNKLIDPVWFHHGVVLPPESPKNVLGSRWLGFDLAGYGIHGTIHPESIGSHETAGCVRMRNEDVEELYSLLPRGVKVVIVN